MEQGLGNIENREQPPLITNINAVSNSTGYILTRDNNNNVVVEETPPPIISNINSVNQSTNYVLTRDENNNVVVEEQAVQIQNLSGIADNERYHITRRVGNVLAILDRSIQLPIPNIAQDILFAIRKQGDNYSITRTPALSDYVFETDDLQFFSSFNVLGTRASRAVHVCNLTGKLVKFGLLHVNLSNNQGLINRQYRFNVTINDRNTRLISVNTNTGSGSSRSRTIDTENLNIFFSGGDTLGIRYQRGGGANTGNYCQVRLTVDANARQEHFGNFHLP